MHQLGFHLTPNHLMQYIKAKAIKICKTPGRLKCIRGLPWLSEKSGSGDVSDLNRWINFLNNLIDYHILAFIHYT